MSKSAVVIGAGPGGLATAMLLAQNGVQVKVIERHGHVGGRTSTITDPDGRGFRFDMGPTFFLYPRILEEIFAACGYDLNREVEMVKLDPQYRLLFEGNDGKLEHTLDCTPDIQRMQAEIAKLSEADAKNFGAFIEKNRKKFDAFTPVLQTPFNGLTDVMSMDMIKMLPMVRPHESVDRNLGRFFKDPRVRLAFSFQSKYLGMSPFKCPSLFTILSYLEYDYGVFHPIGGCGAVSEAMARVARDMGVEISLNDEVDQLAFRDDSNVAIGVHSTTGYHAADTVVINADFAHAMNKIVPDRVRRRWTDRKLEKKKYSCSTFMLYLGLDGEYNELAHHNIFLANNYTQNLDEIENQHILSENPSIYVQNPCITDSSMSPEGKTSLYVLAPVSHQHENINWAQETPRFRKRVLDQMAKLNPSLADLEDKIEFEKVLTPAGWQDDMAIYRGATFNLAHTLTQMLHLRPRNRFEDLKNVYLVGGGTHPGSGLPVIFESARISTNLLLEDQGITPNWSDGNDNTTTQSDDNPGTSQGVSTPELITTRLAEL